MRSLLLSAALLCAVLRGRNVKAEDTDNPMTGNVVDVAFSMPQTFSTLIFLLTRAGLVDVLRDPTLDSTVFSPTNDAFIALDALNLPSANTRVLSADDDWLPHLQDFLTYHVLGGSEVFAEDITDGLTVTMLNGEESSFSLADGVAINTATVVAADVTANNGVIHVIDEVLVPSWVTNSIVDRSVATPELSTLVALVTLADLVEVLDGPGKLTVFAPTDDAFNALLTALNVGIDYFEANTDFLTDVLTYHVVRGIFDADELSRRISVRSLQGERLFFDVSEDSTLRCNGNAVLRSVLANNGIIHVIDGVLAPSTPFPATTGNTIVDVAIGLPDTFSTLTTLATLADFVEILSQPFQFTVFAPVNDAFAALDAGLVAKLGTRQWKSHLRSILEYHCIEGSVLSTDIQNGMMAPTLYGDSLAFGVSEDGVFVNENVQVINADVIADNGVIHAVDNVLLPGWLDQTIVDVCASYNRLRTFVRMLRLVGFDSMLAGPGPFTVLAPTDRAFQRFLAAIRRSTSDLVALEQRFGTVTNLLRYHLFDGIIDRERLMTGPTLITKYGYRVQCEVSQNGVLSINGARFVVTDIVAANGIVHIIDTVSLP